MRDYGRITPQFWTSHIGRLIRKLGPIEQLLAVYLLSSPSSNMTGLYYLPIPTICHELGISEKEVLKALEGLTGVRWSEYDHASEVIWIYEMAESQIAEQLHSNDKRCKGAWRELSAYRHTKFFKPFYERYWTKFHLPPLEFPDSSGSPFEAPSMPLGSQDQNQKQKQEQIQESGGLVLSLAARPKSELAWLAYAEAYRRQYGVDPIRNAKTNAQLCQLVDRLGADLAPQVAGFYPTHQHRLYVQARHPTNLLLRDAEALRTDFSPGNKAIGSL